MHWLVWSIPGPSEASILVLSMFSLQVFQWQLFPRQPPVFRAGRCAVVRTRQGQTRNPGLRPSRQSTVKPFSGLSAVSDSPLTTDNLIRKAPQKPARSRSGRPTTSLVDLRSTHPRHLQPNVTEIWPHGDGPHELLFRSNTEPVLFSHAAHGNEAAGRGRKRRWRAHTIIRCHSYNSIVEEVVHISSTPLPPSHVIPATVEPLPNTPAPYSHHFLFLICIYIFISRVENRRGHGKIRPSQQNPSTKDHSWIDWSGLGQRSGRDLCEVRTLVGRYVGYWWDIGGP